MHGACNFCGCALNECECGERRTSHITKLVPGLLLVEDRPGFSAKTFFAELRALRKTSPLAALAAASQVFRGEPGWVVPAVLDGKVMPCPKGMVIYRH